MPQPSNPTDLASVARRRSSLGFFFLGLPLMALLALGCGSPTTSEQQANVVKEDPEGEFQWGIHRLERALRVFRPSSADGLNVTDRNLDHELFPPSDANATYTARVTITTEASFLHAKRQLRKGERPSSTDRKGLEIEDPLAEKSEVTEFIDIPGTGTNIPAVAAVRIKPRTIENKTVFDLVYRKGRWKLKEQPELDHEQMWFEYAFD